MIQDAIQKKIFVDVSLIKALNVKHEIILKGFTGWFDDLTPNSMI